MDQENVVHLHNGISIQLKYDILKFADKWLDLKNIILSNSDPNRQIYVFTHKQPLDIIKKNSIQITIPENLGNNEDPKRDIHGYNVYGK